MENEKPNIHFMLSFTEQQLEFIMNPANNRAVVALLLILRKTHFAPAVEQFGMIKLKLSAGTSAVADTEFRRMFGCGHTAARTIIKKLNKAGFIKTKYGHPLCVHAVLCLKGWRQGNTVIVNPEAKDIDFLL